MGHLNFAGKLLLASSRIFAGLPTEIKFRGGKATITVDLFEIERREEPCLKNGRIATESYWYYRLAPGDAWEVGGRTKTEVLCKALSERANYDAQGSCH